MVYIVYRQPIYNGYRRYIVIPMEDIMDDDKIEDMLEDDEITAAEEGFLRGYDTFQEE